MVGVARFAAAEQQDGAGGSADAAAKARDKGAAITGEVSIDAETTIYTMSESGLIAKVNLAGTKYWRDDSLNY